MKVGSSNFCKRKGVRKQSGRGSDGVSKARGPLREDFWGRLLNLCFRQVLTHISVCFLSQLL